MQAGNLKDSLFRLRSTVNPVRLTSTAGFYFPIRMAGNSSKHNSEMEYETSINFIAMHIESVNPTRLPQKNGNISTPNKLKKRRTPAKMSKRDPAMQITLKFRQQRRPTGK
jgi:hypothetical protein